MVREELPAVRNWLLSLQEDAKDCAEDDKDRDETRNPPILIHHSVNADTLAEPACPAVRRYEEDPCGDTPRGRWRSALL
jgi:hypothetical protein